MLEGELQRAGTKGFEGFGDELKLAAFFINGDAAAYQNVQRDFRSEAQKRCLPAEEDDGKLSLLILQSEVEMTGTRRAEIRDFAFDPAVGVIPFEAPTNLCNKPTDGPDAARFRLPLNWKQQPQLTSGIGVL